MDAAILLPVGGTMPVDRKRQGSETKAMRKHHRKAFKVSGTFFGVFQCKHCKTRAISVSISLRFAARVIALPIHRRKR